MPRYLRPTIRNGKLRGAPIKLKRLNTQKHKQRKQECERQERQRLIQVMYGRDDLYREYLERQRMELEIDQMRASLNLEPLEANWATNTVVGELALNGIDVGRNNGERVSQMARAELRRKRK